MGNTMQEQPLIKIIASKPLAQIDPYHELDNSGDGYSKALELTAGAKDALLRLKANLGKYGDGITAQFAEANGKAQLMSITLENPALQWGELARDLIDRSRSKYGSTPVQVFAGQALANIVDSYDPYAAQAAGTYLA